jgi:hypothetical protein
MSATRDEETLSVNMRSIASFGRTRRGDRDISDQIGWGRRGRQASRMEDRPDRRIATLDERRVGSAR